MTSKKRKWLVGLAVLVVLGGAGGGFAAMKMKEKAAAEAKKKADEAKGPPMVEFVPSEIGQVSQRSLSRTVLASGSLVASRSATVRSKVGAEVRSISLREGDSVALGQAIAQLDVVESTERVRAAQGLVAAAEARAANAKTTRDTQKRLLDQAYISAAAFDGYESGYKAALGDLDSAKANAALARQSVADSATRAPMAGVVAKRFVNPGEKIGFDAPLVQIVDLSSLELQAWVDPEVAGSLKIGQAVTVQVSGFEQELAGSLARVMPAVDPATRQLGIVVALKPHKLPLKAGLDASAKLSFAAAASLSTVVPGNAMQSANGEPFLWVLQSKPADSQVLGTTTVQRLRVSTGTRDDAAGVVAVSASAPMPAGTQVLVGRYDGLKDGQTVRRVAVKTPPVVAPVAPAASAVASSVQK